MKVMKRYSYFLLISLLLIVSTALKSQNKNETMDNSALLIIDIQDFYFPGGMLPLVEPDKAAKNAQALLNHFREEKKTVIHVRHNASSGADIHFLVKPLENEKIISKDKANAFVGTDLLEYLKENKIENLVLCGMQTHMCLEAATRAASYYGFKCTVVEDACTTRDLEYGDITVHAKDVHYATLSALNRTYATIKTTKQLLDELKNE
jgi:nicotinamidase-related amidase